MSPTLEGRNGEFCWVVVHPDAHPAAILRHVIDALGDCRAYLLVGGGHHVWEEAIESLVNPRQSKIEQMIEPRFTPTHTYPFEALLDQPFTGAFH